MGLGLRAPHLARQPHPGPYPQAATDRTIREPLIASPSRSRRAGPIPLTVATAFRETDGPDPEGASCSRGSGSPPADQSTVQPSASRSALWIAVAAMAASAPATAIWFRPLTTSPAA